MWTGASSRCSQLALSTFFNVEASPTSSISPPGSDPLSSAPSFSKWLRLQIWWLQSQSSTFCVRFWYRGKLMNQLLLDCGVTTTNDRKSNNKTPLRFRSGRLFVPQWVMSVSTLKRSWKWQKKRYAATDMILILTTPVCRPTSDTHGGEDDVLHWKHWHSGAQDHVKLQKMSVPVMFQVPQSFQSLGA